MHICPNSNEIYLLQVEVAISVDKCQETLSELTKRHIFSEDTTSDIVQPEGGDGKMDIV
jgi:hypothetical protein